MKKIFIFSSVVFLLAIALASVPLFTLPAKMNNILSSTKSRIIYSLGGAGTTEAAENHPASEVFHLRSVAPDSTLSEIVKAKEYKDRKEYNVYIDLSTRTLDLKYADTKLKSYRIACGSSTKLGNKEKEGDYRTPQGEFYICSKEVYAPSKKYLGSRWMLLSYPGIEAAEYGLKANVIDNQIYDKIHNSISKKKLPPQNTPLGSAVGIHGGAVPQYPKDWTAGCIGMYDQDVEEIFEYVDVGTKVVIK